MTALLRWGTLLQMHHFTYSVGLIHGAFILDVNITCECILSKSVYSGEITVVTGKQLIAYDLTPTWTGMHGVLQHQLARSARRTVALLGVDLLIHPFLTHINCGQGIAYPPEQ